MELGLPTGTLAADLGLQVASFAAGSAVVNAVFTKADFIKALAQRAVFVAGAGSLRLVADHAHEFFGHGRRLSRFWLTGNGTMVDGLAGNWGLRSSGYADNRATPRMTDLNFFVQTCNH
jgi:hypothetical protein